MMLPLLLALCHLWTANSLQPIEQEIEKSPKETLVLLDVRGTLIVSRDAVLHPAHEGWKKRWIQTHCPNMTREERTAIVAIVENASDHWKLTDPAWPKVIEKANANGSKVAALTKVLTDPSLKNVRATRLRELGLPLYDDLRGLRPGETYSYARGVIETEAPLKGPVLKELISHLKERPEKIVFVDDRIEQARSVHEACEELGIPCAVFHYAPNAPTPPLDPKVAHMQLFTLIHEKRWVTSGE